MPRLISSIRSGASRALTWSLALAVLLIASSAHSATITMTVDKSTITEGEVATFTITRTGGSTAASTVNIAKTGTATNGTDYSNIAATSVVVPSGTNPRSITVVLTSTPDAIADDGETMILTISGFSHTYTVSTRTVTINDPDVSIAMTQDGSEPGTPGLFTVTRAIATSNALTISLVAPTGTATSGSDYTALPTTVTIPSNSLSVGISVPVQDDAIVEGDETVTLSIASNPRYNIVPGAGSDTLTITDNDLPTVTVAFLNDGSETGPAAAKFRITRSASTPFPLAVSFNLTGTATNGTDYSTVSSPVTIPANTTTIDVTVTPIDDATPENDETVILTITGGAGSYIIGGASSATVSIADNEQPAVSVSATDSIAAEVTPATNPGVFTISRVGTTSTAVLVNFTFSGSASGTDYVAVGVTATIPIGQSSVNVTITPVDDVTLESDESLILTLQGGAYSIGTVSATVTINDNETPTVSVVASDNIATEATPSTDPGVFTISRVGTQSTALTVVFALSGTATAADYAGVGTSVVIPAGQGSAQVIITPADDATLESDETVIFTIQNNAAYTITTATASLSLNDNEPAAVTVAATDPNAAENTPATAIGVFTFSRTGTVSIPLTIGIALGGTAIAADYSAVGASVIIPVGQATTTLTITPVDDVTTETDETVIVTIQPNAAYTITTPSATITIVDNEMPVVSVSATTPVGAEGGGPAVFTLSRVGNSAPALNVVIALSGTAIAADYAAVGGTITIPAGQPAINVFITPVDDATLESDETVILTIQPNAAYTIGVVSTTVTINDNEQPQISVSATDATATEGTPATDSGRFTITRVGTFSTSLTITFSIAGTATSATDFTAVGTTAVIPAGQSNVNVLITAVDDATLESDETVVITLQPGPYSITTGGAVIILNDNEVPTVSIVANITNVPESGPIGQFTLTRVGTLSTSVPVNYAITGTGTNGTDYSLIGVTATIPIGSATRTITITPTDDATAELDETAILTITANAGIYSIGSPSNATVTINDNDPPQVSVAATDPSASEANAATDVAVFTISRVGTTTTACTVNFSLSGAAVPADFAAVTSPVVIPVGQTSTTITITCVNDAIVEIDENVMLTITAGAYTIGSASASITIIDNETPIVTISATDATASETPTNPGVFTIARLGTSTVALTVTFALSGTATSGTDFPSIGTTAVIPIGAQTVTVTLTPTDDAAYEGPETVIATLSTGAYTIGSPSSSTVTINDNDLPTVSISATDASAGEPSNNGTFTVTRTGILSLDGLTVNYAIGGTATNAGDYAGVSGVVVIPINQATATITVTMINDTIPEPDETVIFTIQTDASYTIGSPSTATVTVVDEDPPNVSIAATDGTASEPSDPGVFTFTRVGNLANALTINYSVGGTAANGTDYSTLTSPIVIAAGQSSRTLTITVINDTLTEGSETVTVTITSNVAYNIIAGAGVSTVTIIDDEPPIVSISAIDPLASEPGLDTGTFQISRTGSTVNALTIVYTLPGTSTSGVDYEAFGAIVLAANQASVNVKVTPFDDLNPENDESVTVTLALGSGYVLGAPTTATVVIVDNETPVITVSATTPTATENSTTGKFTVTRLGTSTYSLLVNFTVAGSAPGTRYAAIGTSVTIPVSQQSILVTVTPVNDAVAQNDQTVVLTLAASGGGTYTLGAQTSATVTIIDDEKPVVSIAATTPNASETGPVNGQFTVTRVGNTVAAVTVTVALSGTATNSSDYSTLSTSVVIPLGSSTGTANVNVIDDTLYEGAELVTLTIQTNAAYTLGTPTAASVSIADDDLPLVTVSATDNLTLEPGIDVGVFTLTRNGILTSGLTVFYTVTGSATPVQDYISLPGVAFIPVGTASITLTITAQDDLIVEDDETVVFNVSPNSLYALNASSIATVLVRDNEVPEVNITATDASAAESAAATDTGTVLITRKGNSAAPMTVNYSVGGIAVMGTDFLNITSPIVLPANVKTATITITTKNDTVAENDEAAAITLAAPTLATDYQIGPQNTALVNIVDDDPPVVSVATTDNVAVEPGLDVGIFTVTRVGNTIARLTVFYTVSGNAIAGSDYQTLTGSVVIPIGSSSAEVTVIPLDDTLVEADETVSITLTANAAYGLAAPTTASLTVADDEAAVITLSVADATASEPGSDVGQFVLSRFGATLNNVTINFNFTGTAVNGFDFATLGTFVVIPAGVSTAAIIITPLDDTSFEGNETAGVQLIAGTGYSLGTTTSGTVTIGDNDVPTITISATTATAVEGGSVGVFTISREGITPTALTVFFSVAGTATSGSDYTALGTSTVIPAGSNTKTVTVTTIEDPATEVDESVTVQITANAAYAVGGAPFNQSTVVIVDNDAPIVSVSASTPSGAEGGTSGVFTISRTGVSTAAVVVNYAVTGTAAMGTDYSNFAPPATIPGGARSVTITVTPFDDSLSEGDETAIVTLNAGTGYTVGAAGTATVIVIDNDLVVSVSATVAATAESGSPTPGQFVVTRTGAVVSSMTVNYFISGTSATGDYSALPATITIPAGQSSVTVLITPVDDVVAELDETVIFNLSAGNYSLSPTNFQATVTIIDNEPPVITMSASDDTATEQGATTGTFTLTRVGNTVAPVTVNYTIGGTAVNNTDYRSITTSAVIPTGVASVTLTITPIDDTTFEAPETVILTLGSGVGYSIGTPNTGTVTITDNDVASVAVNVPDGLSSEPGSDRAFFQLVRTGLLTDALTVSYQIGGTATPGADYTPILSSAVIPAGTATVNVTVSPIDDGIAEPPKTVTLGLLPDPTYIIALPSNGFVTINDDDQPVVSVTSTFVAALEFDNVKGEFVFSRIGNTQTALTVNFNVTGSASSGSDFTALGTSIVIPIGSQTVSLLVSFINDTNNESDETVNVSVANGTGYTVGPPSFATFTIQDDDIGNDNFSQAIAFTGSLPITKTGVNFTATRENGEPFHADGIGGVSVWWKWTPSSSGRVTLTTGGSDFDTLLGVYTGVTVSALTLVAANDDDPLTGDFTSTVSFVATAGTTYYFAVDGYLGERGSVKLTLDQPSVAIVATDSIASEPGGDIGMFVITRTGSVSYQMQVDFVITGTTTADRDYASFANYVVIPPGVTSVQIEVTVFDDTEGEDNELLTLTLADSDFYTISGSGNATVTIIDNGDFPVVTIAATDPNATEGGADAGVFSVIRSGPSTGPLTVNYTMGGSAIPGVDYVPVSGSVRIPAGQLTAEVRITAIDDFNFEGQKTVVATIAALPAYNIGTSPNATVKINDNDQPLVSIAASSPSSFEGGAAGSFTINRSGTTLNTLTVLYQTSGNAGGGTDYVALPGSIVIPAGFASASLPVVAREDALSEPDEFVIVTVIGASTYKVSSQNRAQVKVVDNDPPVVSIFVADTSASEPADTATFTVQRVGNTTNALTVNFTLAGTAVQGVDYVPLGGFTVIPTGSATVNVVITPIDDTLAESIKTVTLNIALSPTYTRASFTASVSLLDNEPQVSVSATDNVATEPGSDTGTFVVSRTGSTQTPLTVTFNVSGNAIKGVDYQALPTFVVIPIGFASTSLTVRPIDDTTPEAKESVIFTLTKQPTYSTGAAVATVNINDDEPTVTVNATDPQASEPGFDIGRFTFNRTGSITAALVVTFTIGGTATNGTDYLGVPNSITFPPGSSSFDLFIRPLDDAGADNNETVVVQILKTPAYNVGNPAIATIQLTDDEPVVTVSAVQNANEQNRTLGLIRLTRTGGNVYDLPVNIAVAGNATAGLDYVSLAKVVLIPAGQNSVDVPVNPFDDDLGEGNESVIITAQKGEGYSVGAPASDKILILDNEPIVTVSAIDPAASELGVDTGRFELSRTGDLTRSVFVSFTLSGTSTRGADYTDFGTSIVFPSGVSTVAIVVTPVADTTAEGNETVTLSLLRGPDYTFAIPATSTVTITDNSPIVSITVLNNVVKEDGTSNGLLQVSRTGNLTNSLKVNFTSGGTATNGVDYLSIGNNVIIPTGSAVVLLNIVAINDTIGEATESGIIALAKGLDYKVGSPGSGTVNIYDNEPVVSITCLKTMTEGGGPQAAFTVSRTGVSTSSLVVAYSIAGTALNNVDYARISSSVIIPSGSATATITITPVDDTTGEGDETIQLRLLKAAPYNVSPTQITGILTLKDDEPIVKITTADNSASEPGDPARFIITRAGSVSASVIVSFTVTGSATNGVDYMPITNFVIIPAGSVSASVIVTPIDDSLVENTETVMLVLIKTGGYSLGVPPSGTANLFDDEPVVSISATDPIASEPGIDRGVFTITRTGALTSHLTVNVTIQGSAINGTDYVLASPVVVIPSGSATARITITPLDDTSIEATENIIVTLQTSPTYSFGSTTVATVELMDDESQISCFSLHPSINETSGFGAFLVVRSGSTATDLTVSLTVSGTAINNGDYQLIQNFVVIPAGLASMDVQVVPIDDAVLELDETVTLAIAVNPNYTLSTPNSASMIISDTEPPIVSVAATVNTALEPGERPGVFTVSRFGSVGGDMTVVIVLSGVAVEGADYEAIGTEVVLPSGVGAVEVTVTAVDDGQVEPGESVILTIQPDPTYIVGGASTATVTVRDNQAPTVASSPTATPNAAAANSVVTLSAFGTDPDSNPMPLTYTWTKVSGPGNVLFSSNGTDVSATTTATFDKEGSYRLQVSISDGHLTVTDSVDVIVTP